MTEIEAVEKETAAHLEMIEEEQNWYSDSLLDNQDHVVEADDDECSQIVVDLVQLLAVVEDLQPTVEELTVVEISAAAVATVEEKVLVVADRLGYNLLYSLTWKNLKVQKW